MQPPFQGCSPLGLALPLPGSCSGSVSPFQRFSGLAPLGLPGCSGLAPLGFGLASPFQGFSVAPPLGFGMASPFQGFRGWVLPLPLSPAPVHPPFQVLSLAPPPFQRLWLPLAQAQVGPPHSCYSGARRAFPFPSCAKPFFFWQGWMTWTLSWSCPSPQTWGLLLQSFQSFGCLTASFGSCSFGCFCLRPCFRSFLACSLRAARCHFAKCHLSRCHFAKCQLSRCHFAKCHLPNLPRCHFAKCCLSRLHLAKCHLPRCNPHFCKCFAASFPALPTLLSPFQVVAVVAGGLFWLAWLCWLCPAHCSCLLCCQSPLFQGRGFSSTLSIPNSSTHHSWP